VPLAPGCPGARPASPEVTRAICRVPSTPFARSPGYARPVHLCRFRVRSLVRGLFPGDPRPPPQSGQGRRRQDPVTTRGPRNVDLVAIGYAFRPRLRGRLTLRGSAWRRNPWTSGGSVSHAPRRYSCQHSHSPCLQRASRPAFAGLGDAPLPRAPEGAPAASARGLSPVTSSARGSLARPVSCYAFFKGWLLLSQPPGCPGRPTSFPT
jgi:hypothetical protein